MPQWVRWQYKGRDSVSLFNLTRVLSRPRAPSSSSHESQSNLLICACSSEARIAGESEVVSIVRGVGCGGVVAMMRLKRFRHPCVKLGRCRRVSTHRRAMVG
jgi:hypothetical protein